MKFFKIMFFVSIISCSFFPEIRAQDEPLLGNNPSNHLVNTPRQDDCCLNICACICCGPTCEVGADDSNCYTVINHKCVSGAQVGSCILPAELPHGRRLVRSPAAWICAISGTALLLGGIFDGREAECSYDNFTHSCTEIPNVTKWILVASGGGLLTFGSIFPYMSQCYSNLAKKLNA